MKRFKQFLEIFLFLLATVGILTGVICQIVIAYKVYGESGGQVITPHWTLSFFSSIFLAPLAWLLGFGCWRD